MILKKTATKVSTIKNDIPLSYEYDSSSESVVLLDGYAYLLFYNSNSMSDFNEIIDLKTQE